VIALDFVEPIRDMAKINEMKNELLKTGYKNYLLFVVGINTGLRISDILQLKVTDVKNMYISIKEKKTGKSKKFLINNQLRLDIDKYIYGMSDDEYLFQSRNGINKPISRIQAYRILKNISYKIGLEDIGTHTLRKTFGYWHYQQNKDVALLQELFNHSAPSITLKYIGLSQDNLDSTIQNFYL